MENIFEGITLGAINGRSWDDGIIILGQVGKKQGRIGWGWGC